MKISTYAVDGLPDLNDKLIGTKLGGSPADATYNFTLRDLLNLYIPLISANVFKNVLTYTGNTQALANGLVIGNIYRQTGTDFLCIVH
jgi:hypothetical protein